MDLSLHPLVLIGFIGVLCAILLDAVLVEVVSMSKVSARYKFFEFQENLAQDSHALVDLEDTPELV